MGGTEKNCKAGQLELVSESRDQIFRRGRYRGVRPPHRSSTSAPVVPQTSATGGCFGLRPRRSASPNLVGDRGKALIPLVRNHFTFRCNALCVCARRVGSKKGPHLAFDHATRLIQGRRSELYHFHVDYIGLRKYPDSQKMDFLRHRNSFLEHRKLFLCSRKLFAVSKEPGKKKL